MLHPAGCAGARRERRTAEGAVGQEERGHGRDMAGDTAGDRRGAVQGCQAVESGETGVWVWVCPGQGSSIPGSSIPGCGGGDATLCWDTLAPALTFVAQVDSPG